MNTETAEHPCVVCGLCCDGTLFLEAYFKENEDQSLYTRTGTEGDRDYFELGCEHFNKCCQIYEKRAQVCRSFKCQILKKYEAKKLSYDKTIAIINKTKALSQEVLRLFPNERNSSKISTLRFTKEHTKDLKNAAFRKKNADLIFAVLGLRKARRQFIGRKKKTVFQKIRAVFKPKV